jgi:2-keto-4-pentenoate hydratase/2-oxohepta-3-ene-1,7-dioic acid hydratase in catechol pathway
VANDVSLRDRQSHSPPWSHGKASSRRTPLGPWVATVDELGDAMGLEIGLALDGVELQRAKTDPMLFDVPTTIAGLSEFAQLDLGDIIVMRTPSSVGFKRDSPEHPTPGGARA